MSDESLYRVNGTEGDDTIRGGDGDDIIRGGSGYNTVIYWGYEQDFQSTWLLDPATGALTITAVAGTATESLGNDTLYNIQAVGFYEWDSFSGQYYYYERQIDDQSNLVDLAGDDLTGLAFGAGQGGVINYAGDVDAQFVYDTRSQMLSVDADGSGDDAAVELFELAGSGVSINYDDVYVLI